MERGIPFVRITAKDNYDFGFQLGRKLKERIVRRLADNRKVYEKHSGKKCSYEDLVKKSLNFVPAIKKYFPDLLIEAEAMAAGARVDFSDMLVAMCDEEIVDFVFATHCTTVALKDHQSGEFLLGHNEDWYPEFIRNGLFLVNGKIGANKFLALGYMGSLAGTAGGMNRNGVAYSDTSFYFSRFDYKVPRSFHLRALLDVKNHKNARDILNEHGSIASNTLFVFANQGIYDIEELWEKEIVLRKKNWLIHTNHPLSRKNQSKNNSPRESQMRLARAEKLLMKEEKYDIGSIKRILSDHEREICGHRHKKSGDKSVTLASVIFNPRRKTLLLSETNPCKNRWKEYKL